MDTKAKDDLLNIVLEINEEDRRANRRVFLAVVVILLLSLIFAIPQIYIRNHIYYKSRNIAQLKYQYSALKQENIVLKQRLQELKFKNQTIDTIY